MTDNELQQLSAVPFLLDKIMSVIYNLKRIVISWFADIRIYWLGLIIFGDSHYKLKGNDMRDALELLEPGDVLLRKYDHYVGSILIKGYWSHAAFYSGDNWVVHMLGQGIVREDILSFMRCDDMAILRCKDDKLKHAAITTALMLYGTGTMEYDYDFDFTNHDKMSCTEFVNYLYGDPQNKRILLPDDLERTIFNTIWRKRNDR